MSKVATALALIIAVFSFQNGSHAQTRTDMVCWANEAQAPLCGNAYQEVRYNCGSGGFSGFHPDFVCQQTCGANRGPKCKITPGPGGEGGQCGFRAARVDCY